MEVGERRSLASHYTLTTAERPIVCLHDHRLVWSWMVIDLVHIKYPIVAEAYISYFDGVASRLACFTEKLHAYLLLKQPYA